MTLAICIRCGTEKVGAFTPCPQCHFMPEEPDDKAKSLMLSDHNMPADKLHAVAASIQAGNEPKFNADALASISNELCQIPIDAMKPPVGCTIAMWTPIVILIVLVIVTIAVFAFIFLNKP